MRKKSMTISKLNFAPISPCKISQHSDFVWFVSLLEKRESSHLSFESWGDAPWWWVWEALLCSLSCKNLSFVFFHLSISLFLYFCICTYICLLKAEKTRPDNECEKPCTAVGATQLNYDGRSQSLKNSLFAFFFFYILFFCISVTFALCIFVFAVLRSWSMMPGRSLSCKNCSFVFVHLWIPLVLYSI